MMRRGLDRALPTLPGNGVPAQLDGVSLAIHKAYAPVVATGRSDTAGATIDVPADKRYFVSVLPYTGHAPINNVPDAGEIGLGGCSSGTLRLDHFSRPPGLQAYFAGAWRIG